MGFWRKKKSEFEKTEKLIVNNPGLIQSEIARRLGISPSTLARRFSSMNDAGILLSQDDKGGIWAFKRKN